MSGASVFSPRTYQRRRSALRKSLRTRNLPGAILVSNITNIRYLTGFTGSAGWLLLGPKVAVLISDSRYTSQIQDECPGLDAEIRTSQQRPLEFLAQTIERHHFRQLAIEADDLTQATYAALDCATANSELVPASNLVSPIRALKDNQEIAQIRTAIHVAEKAITTIRSQLTGDQTETDVAHLLENEIRRLGGSGCSFEPIVAVGARSALPHARFGQQKIADAPMVLLDWGARVGGYVSDLTRVWVTAKISPKYARIYEVVQSAQQAAIDAIAPGVELSAVDRAARSVIEKAGFGGQFGHGLGHGIGLQVHEAPLMSQVAEGTLQPSMVITVEPGIYLPNLGGVRIEDDVLVTEDGREVLSGLPRDLESNTLPEGHLNTF